MKLRSWTDRSPLAGRVVGTAAVAGDDHTDHRLTATILVGPDQRGGRVGASVAGPGDHYALRLELGEKRSIVLLKKSRSR